MRPLALLLVLPLCTVPALAQPDPHLEGQAFNAQPKKPQLTPQQRVESTVRVFADALNGVNPYFDALSYVANVRNPGYFGGPEWATSWQQNRGTLRLEISKVDILELKETTAQVSVNYVWSNRALYVSTVPITEKLNLAVGTPATGGEARWQIVPPRTPDEAEQLGVNRVLVGADGRPVIIDNAPILNQCVSVIANPEDANGLKTARTAATAQQSTSNLKQLGLGTLMFLQDWDERFAFAPQFYRDALLPYLKSADVFVVPATGESYTFNANLSGQMNNDGHLAHPAQTVLFYEGQNETPVFRYDGRAAILFADGHVKLVTPDEAKTLIWKP